MFGTIVNTIAVIVGSLVGLLLKSRIKPEFGVGISKSLGIATLVIGINGVIANMFTVGADGSLSSSGELLLVISLAVGTLVGEMFHLDDHLQHFSSTVEQRFSIGGFATGFMNATLLYCVGAMTIVGALNDGISGDSSILLVKSALDGVSSIVLAASMGVGVLFSS
ncbi:MAG: DUF554 domain-containing protein, partial [Lachnospiraceae bacterium]|nr:DUF554 domain-containing protein [Candidatus Equihabitans merdae]